ncbi:MAG: 2,3-bisphosphoglycerate-independent phosphoglycerate mutase, partial [Candidatus Magasanikbacteria bacterium]|nr:2,3-bisphosphoglycerate-independent phosphoglycerate mutase [Candidatus Magasanikbacteria bacterium]
EEKYDVIFMNFANADMVGHTGKTEATIKGCEAIDRALGQIADHVLAKGGVLLITADHGNGEEVVNLQTGEQDKEHSNNPVPLLVIGNQYKGQAGPSGDVLEGDLSLMSPVGVLADIAPTVLAILGVEQPPEMTGRALI